MSDSEEKWMDDDVDMALAVDSPSDSFSPPLQPPISSSISSSSSSSSPPPPKVTPPPPDPAAVAAALVEADRLKKIGNDKYSKGDYDDAILFYTKAINVVLDDVNKAALLNNRAAAHLMLKQFDKAVDDGFASVDLDNSNVKTFQRLIKSLLSVGKFDEAKSLQYQIPQSSGQKTALFSLDAEMKEIDLLSSKFRAAKDALEGGRLREAKSNCDMILSKYHDCLRVKLISVEILLKQKNFTAAKEIINDLYEKYKNNVEILRLRGLTQLYAGNIEMAQKHFQMILQQDPDNTKAQQLFKMVKKMEQKKADGNAAFQAQKWQQAYDLYSEVLAIDPINDAFNSTVYCNRAAAALKLRKWLSAVEDCNKTLEYKEDFAKALIRRAQAYMKLEKFDDAVRDLEAAIKMEPNSADLQQQLKEAKLEQKKAKRKDYYKILGVDKDADQDAIRKAYRKAALQWHPDKNNETEEKRKFAEAKFKDITEAHEILSDEEKKRRYDSGVDLEEDGPGGFPGGAAGVDMSQIFQAMFGGGGMGGGMGGMGGMPFSFHAQSGQRRGASHYH